MNKHSLLPLKAILLSIITFCGLESLAVPPDPRVYGVKAEQYVTSQPILETMESYSDRPKGSASGIQEVVVILIELQDAAHDPSHDKVYFNKFLFSESNPRSMYSYYREVSYGQTLVYGTIAGWYHSSYNMRYYGADGIKTDSLNGPVYELAREAIKLADSAGFDFSQYDKNQDGYIDHIIVVHTGWGQETGGGSYGPNAIWSHHWSMWPHEKVDGVLAADYSMVSEFSPLGTLAHEFGHDLGLPDLYDADGSSEGIGIWCVMGNGSWQMGGDVPAHFCAWSKVFLGWAEPREVTTNETGLILNCVERSNLNAILKIPGLESTSPDEYFLLENRNKAGFDQYLPGEGILIWHIDDSATDNKNEAHKKVDLEEADGRDDLDKRINSGDRIDPYYKNNAQEFTPTTIPSSRLYSGDNSRVSVMNVSDPGAAMSMDIMFTTEPEPAQEMTIHLEAGWNLISLYLQPLDTRRESVLSSAEGKCKSIWKYDGDAGGWQKYIADGPPSMNDLDRVVAGTGYWIMMSQPGELIALGVKPAEAIPLKAGWNLVGCNSQTSIAITELAHSFGTGGTEFDSIATYNSQAGNWLWHNVNNPAFLNSLKSLEPGNGYWIHAKENCTWQIKY